MEQYYQFDITRFAGYAKKRLSKSKEWQKRKRIAALLAFFALFLFAASVIVIAGSSPNASTGIIAISVAVGLIAAVIPGSISLAYYNHNRSKLGAPYTNMTKVFLYTNYSGIQLGYHDRTNRESSESVDVYQMVYANTLRAIVDKDNEEITLLGRLEFVSYDDATMSRVRDSFTNGQFGDEAELRIPDCFANREEFIQTLRDHNVEVIYQ